MVGNLHRLKGGRVAHPAAELMDRLGLTEDELMRVLELDPLTLLSGQLVHRPELGILLALLAEASERVGDGALRRWVRTGAPGGSPLDLLLARDFEGFEDALGLLMERGFVLRAPGG